MNNNTIPQDIDIKNKVLEKIISEKVKMRPKFYFMLKLFGLFITLTLVLVVSSLFVSYILFTLRISGQFFLLGLGWKGFQSFVLLFPWIFLLFDCILLIILDWLLKKFSFAYHSPLLYLFVGTLAVILIVGYIINITSLHKDMLIKTQSRQLPIFGSFYKNLADPVKNDGIFRGVVVSIDENTFVVRCDDFDDDGDGDEEKVVLLDTADASTLVQIGQAVFVAGDRINGEIHAYGIREILPAY